MNEHDVKFWKWIGGLATAAALALLTLMLNLLVGVSRDAQIALDVAAQHGQEINIVRAELSSLRTEMSERTADRYRAQDAERDLRYLERRIEALEKDKDK